MKREEIYYDLIGKLYTYEPIDPARFEQAFFRALGLTTSSLGIRVGMERLELTKGSPTPLKAGKQTKKRKKAKRC